MKAKVFAEEFESRRRRYLGTVIYDNALRVRLLYQDEIDEDNEKVVLIDIPE